jgi:hypothetical protein
MTERERQTGQQRLAVRLAWFVGLWLMGVAAIALVAWLLRLLVR